MSFLGMARKWSNFISNPDCLFRTKLCSYFYCPNFCLGCLFRFSTYRAFSFLFFIFIFFIPNFCIDRPFGFSIYRDALIFALVAFSGFRPSGLFFFLRLAQNSSSILMIIWDKTTWIVWKPPTDMLWDFNIGSQMDPSSFTCEVKMLWANMMMRRYAQVKTRHAW